MPRPGRDLEVLVARIESVLSPMGAIVKSPDTLRDRVTGQNREVDISIRGKLGSAEFLMICECRDRSASQDVTWIEQLAQKRNDVGAAKAMAVSSSSFTGPALRKAEFLAIETRLLEELTVKDIRDWFMAGDMTITDYHAEVHSFTFNIASEAGDCDLADEFKAIFTDGARATKENIFFCKSNGEKCSALTIWSWVHDHRMDLINPAIPTSGERVRKTVNANFPNADQRYQLPTTQGLVDVVSVQFVVDLWVTYSKVPISRITSYQDGDSALLQTVEYKFSSGEKSYCVSLHRTPDGRTAVCADIR